MTLGEIVEGAKLLNRTKAKAKTLTRVALGLTIVLLLQLAGNFGLVRLLAFRF